ncbi:MAG: 4Fe-4S binding protein [Candidatus Riflebacteria bacterium]|nr:4Fe-4S binding protein [Candidatus Riflebacteria bacterium]
MKRRIVQIISTLITNPYWQGFLQTTIYKGDLKRICNPGMQCYSCPSSITACPLGALQNALANFRDTLLSGHFNFGFFMVGFFGILGMIFGRFICGFFCPFGFLQDILYKIPTVKIKLPDWTRHLKYFLFFGLVIFLPIFMSFYQVSFCDELGRLNWYPSLSENKSGATYPWYCKMVCPVGTFEAGLPKVIGEPEIRESLSFWFQLKWTIMVLFLFLIVVAPRAFCRIGCPIGAIYGFFNKNSLYQLKIDCNSCTKCGLCEKNCPMEIKIHENPGSAECVRCLKCVDECPKNLIKAGFLKNEQTGNNKS